MKKIIKFVNLLFIILIISSVLSYIIQTTEVIKNKQYILWTMDTNIVSTGYIGKIFPYVKDCIAIFLFLILTLFFKKAQKTSMLFLGIIVYGTLLLFGNQYYEIGYIIAGIRTFLYFFVTIMYCQIRYTDKKVFLNIHKVLKILIIVEFFIVFIQVIYSGQTTNFGNGGYRFCGTFGNAGGLGNFTIAANLYIMIYNDTIAKKVKNINYIYLFMNFLLSVASGARVAILSNSLIIFLYWNNFSLSKINFSKNMKILLMSLLAIFAIPTIYNFSINRIGRGPIMDSGGTRIEILLSFFDINNLIEFGNLIVGKGIGFATNNAYLLKVNSAFIADGTISTIIAQFGLFGATCFLIVLIKMISNFWKYSNKNLNLTLSYCFAVIIVILGGNIFEQIAMIILLITTYFMIKKCYIKDKESE